MARMNDDDGIFAKEGHDEGFGPVCVYNGEEPHVCNTQEELDEYTKNGWKDAPHDMGDVLKTVASEEVITEQPTQEIEEEVVQQVDASAERQPEASE